MMAYAQRTDVSTDRSLDEIRRTVQRYGARRFMIGEDEDTRRVIVMFEARDRRVQFVVTLPKYEDFAKTDTGRYRKSDTAQRQAFDQAIRQRYRALLLVIKAKLESVEAGIETFEEAFLAQIVLPDGNTVARWIAPQLEASYESGAMPQMLPLLTSGGSQL
ncbi:MAG: hypothetical protein IT320_18830 [Anaerolineae bacterium]|nr:hypothetical protein [Anaerolineae bacterium]